jgi:hypothetical protein
MNIQMDNKIKDKLALGWTTKAITDYLKKEYPDASKGKIASRIKAGRKSMDMYHPLPKKVPGVTCAIPMAVNGGLGIISQEALAHE